MDCWCAGGNLAGHLPIELGGFDRYKIVYIGFSNRDKTAVSY